MKEMLLNRYREPSDKFEKIEGLRNRALTEDQYELIDAIKTWQEASYYKNFQEYWKVRCDNECYLSEYESYKILAEYAKDTFDRSDWYNFNECISRTFFNGKSLSAKDMAEAYLVAFCLMQMRYKII